MGSSRIFLVGNGPSLRDTDLELMIGEESWASGRIDLIYPSTDWRPTRAFWGEWPKGLKDYRSILAHLDEGYPYWIRGSAAGYLLSDFTPLDFPGIKPSDWKFELPIVFPDQVHLYHWCGTRHAGMFKGEDLQNSIPTAWHLPELCRFGSTMHIMIQQAVLEGYEEIYLIGNDLEFTAGHDNHFVFDYQLGDWSEQRAEMFNKTHVYAHTMARNYAKSHGVVIRNATVGGSLEVYPRVEYGSLF